VIELDGGQHVDREAMDGRRTDLLRKLGWRVLRFWNDEVLNRTDLVLEEIARLVAESRRSSP
jgi:very-short-patch-repair endonuclease